MQEDKKNPEKELDAQQTADVNATPNDGEDDNFINVIEYNDIDSPEYEEIAASHSGRARFAGVKIEERERYDWSKLPLKTKIATFFYSNKAFIILGVVLAAIAILMITSARSEPYDYGTLVMCDFPIYDTEAYDRISDALCEYGEDVDGNGKVNMVTIGYQAVSTNPQDTFDYDTIMATTAFLNDEFGNSRHEYMIVITDKIHFEVMREEFGENIFDSVSGRPQWISLKDSPVAQEFKDLGYTAEMGISLVTVPASDEKMVQQHDAAAKLIESYCEKFGL